MLQVEMGTIKKIVIYILLGLMMFLVTTCTPSVNEQGQPKSSVPKLTDQFSFSVDPIVTGDTGTAEALHMEIVDLWQDYLQMDLSKYLAHFTQDAIRLSARSGDLQDSRDAIKTGLPVEWEAFERPNNRIAEQMTVEHAEFDINGNFATAIYWIAVEGGSLWKYSDQGLVFQSFVRKNKRWLVVHQTDSWSLDYDVKAQKIGAEARVEYDFAYPASNLSRAVKFYSPLLGTPESVTSDRAVFNLKGGRFILASSTWNDMAQVRQNSPNGYAVLDIKDMDATAERIAQVSEVGKPQKIGADNYRYGLDVDENLFVIRQQNFKIETEIKPTMSGFPAQSPPVDTAQLVMGPWLAMDAEKISELYSPEGTWFDDTRLKHRGLERGKGIEQALQDIYWTRYDHASGSEQYPYAPLRFANHR